MSNRTQSIYAVCQDLEKAAPDAIGNMSLLPCDCERPSFDVDSLSGTLGMSRVRNRDVTPIRTMLVRLEMPFAGICADCLCAEVLAINYG